MNRKPTQQDRVSIQNLLVDVRKVREQATRIDGNKVAKAIATAPRQLKGAMKAMIFDPRRKR